MPEAQKAEVLWPSLHSLLAAELGEEGRSMFLPCFLEQWAFDKGLESALQMPHAMAFLYPKFSWCEIKRCGLGQSSYLMRKSGAPVVLLLEGRGGE